MGRPLAVAFAFALLMLSGCTAPRISTQETSSDGRLPPALGPVVVSTPEDPLLGAPLTLSVPPRNVTTAYAVQMQAAEWQAPSQTHPGAPMALLISVALQEGDGPVALMVARLDGSTLQMLAGSLFFDVGAGNRVQVFASDEAEAVLPLVLFFTTTPGRAADTLHVTIRHGAATSLGPSPQETPGRALAIPWHSRPSGHLGYYQEGTGPVRTEGLVVTDARAFPVPGGELNLTFGPASGPAIGFVAASAPDNYASPDVAAYNVALHAGDARLAGHGGVTACRAFSWLAAAGPSVAAWMSYTGATQTGSLSFAAAAFEIDLAIHGMSFQPFSADAPGLVPC